MQPCCSSLCAGIGLSLRGPAIFALTCARLRLRPEEILFLDDLEVSVAAAREFGMHAILFRDTDQAIADVRACLEAEAARG